MLRWTRSVVGRPDDSPSPSHIVCLPASNGSFESVAGSSAMMTRLHSDFGGRWEEGGVLEERDKTGMPGPDLNAKLTQRSCVSCPHHPFNPNASHGFVVNVLNRKSLETLDSPVGSLSYHGRKPFDR